jgi:type II secretory ATPase GspE/PulE/Tfp pilus assembly ATPase PilB-like protein
MSAWSGGWGPQKSKDAESGSFRITKVKIMDGAINAEMFNHVDLKKARAARPLVSADMNGDELLRTVVDYEFMTSFNATGSEAVSVMNRCGFIPLGIAVDGADGNVDTLYVLINERNAAGEATPYMPTDIYRNMTAVLAEKISRAISVRLVRVESSVVNRVIDFIYYRIEISDSSIDEAEVTRPLSVDVQPGEIGVIMQARAWFREALNRGASDIHIEPMDNGLGRIRLRVNGILEILQRRIPVGDLVQIITWVKAQSRMDISEKRKPLDGSVRISYTDSGTERLVDVRISTIPTAFGQKMVMRLLDPSRLKKLAKAGLAGTIWDSSLRRQFETALGMRDGIVLVTGPTGSGKTSTLNVALMHLLSDGVFGDRKNIATIEDPIEYTIPGANQTQINDAAGVSFAKMLRALLRQDPDIILVGEIRDPETAQIAVQAALTGHLILATLHTNDALGAIDRLKDLGISPFLIGSTLRMTQAQRLVRRLCSHCGTKNRLTGDDLRRKVFASRMSDFGDSLLASDATVYEPSKCAYCNWSGFDGRVAVMEMVSSSPELVKAIEKDLSSRQLYTVALANGYRPMLQNGVEMIRAGLTSIAEMETISLTDISDEE